MVGGHGMEGHGMEAMVGGFQGRCHGRGCRGSVGMVGGLGSWLG